MHFHFYTAQAGMAMCVFSRRKAASSYAPLYTAEVKMLYRPYPQDARTVFYVYPFRWSKEQVTLESLIGN
jgi:hypothetical protein